MSTRGWTNPIQPLATKLAEDFAGLPGRQGMQISALSTIIAAQQARGAAPARPTVNAPAAKPAAAAAATASAEEFAPIAFAAQTTAMTATGDASAPPGYLANAPLGSQVDIRV
jgi:hypothetical protein